MGAGGNLLEATLAERNQTQAGCWRVLGRWRGTAGLGEPAMPLLFMEFYRGGPVEVSGVAHPMHHCRGGRKERGKTSGTAAVIEFIDHAGEGNKHRTRGC